MWKKVIVFYRSDLSCLETRHSRCSSRSRVLFRSALSSVISSSFSRTCSRAWLSSLVSVANSWNIKYKKYVFTSIQFHVKKNVSVSHSKYNEMNANALLIFWKFQNFEFGIQILWAITKERYIPKKMAISSCHIKLLPNVIFFIVFCGGLFIIMSVYQIISSIIGTNDFPLLKKGWMTIRIWWM